LDTSPDRRTVLFPRSSLPGGATREPSLSATPPGIYLKGDPMLLALHPAEQQEYADGMVAASRLVEQFTYPLDPRALRAAASSLDTKATTAYELGLAQGLRIVATEVEDGPPLGAA